MSTARSIELLWGSRPPGARGPKPGLTIEEIAGAAIELADAAGLERLSMRRVAERLGAGTMSLYRYVAGKAELLDLMVDRVCGAEAAAPPRRGDWRARLEHVARENLRLYERHPWLAQVFPGRPPLGPGVIGKYDHELSAIEGIGLTDVEMDSVVTLVVDYVRAAALSAAERRSVSQTDEEWWNEAGPALARVYEPGRFPLATRVGNAAAEDYQAAHDPVQAFEFGLERLLDGIEALVAGRQSSSG